MPREEQTWNHGNGAADVGTKEWAEFVRLQLVAQVDHLGEDEESFVGFLEIFREHRAWTLLVKKDGTSFKTIDEFCAYPRPYGLGTSWTTLRPHLVSGMAKRGKSPDEIERALALQVVPEAQKPPAGPGRGKKTRAVLTDTETTRNECGPFSERTTQNLRAINRAPDAVKDAYREGRIGQNLAAKLGPKDPSPDQAAQVAEVAQAIRSVKERGAVESIVREKLGVTKVGPVDRAMGLVRNMNETDVYAFKIKFNDYLNERAFASAQKESAE